MTTKKQPAPAQQTAASAIEERDLDNVSGGLPAVQKVRDAGGR